jgi:hypothetical protein
MSFKKVKISGIWIDFIKKVKGDLYL